ncbi:MAG: phage holin family protein [Deltaproteobacteria bacterium]|nr:phage holin family protein [Deltaproteobacteria bacterium]
MTSTQLPEASAPGSIGALLSRLSRDAIDLASAEVALLKAEAGARSREALLGLVPLATMLVFLGVGLVTLTVGAILALGAFVGYPVSALIIGLVEITIALGAAAAARTRFLRAVADPSVESPRMLPEPKRPNA